MITIKFKNNENHNKISKENHAIKFNYTNYTDRINSPLQSQNLNLHLNNDTPFHHRIQEKIEQHQQE